MTTLEANILIAKFDGVTIGKDRVFKYERNGSQWAAEGLKYHNCWDWLMPVVEKIVKIQPKDESIIHKGEDSYFDNYYPRTFAMINSETKEFMVRINRFPLYQSPNLIEATFQSVVEFIKSLERGEEKI